MKKNKTVVWGAAALCVGMLGFAGCNNQVMGKRGYVPASSDQSIAPMPATEVPAANVTPAAAQPVAPVAKTPKTPSRSQQFQYVPMTAGSSAPVTSAATGKHHGTVASGASGAASSYEVKSGDTIGRIAHRHGVSVAAVLEANHLTMASAKRIQVGQKLVIPAGSGKAVRSSGKAEKSAKNGKSAKSAKPTGRGVNGDGTYTVQPGDSPARIAHRLGIKVSELMKANQMTAASAKRLRVGQKLVIPGKGESVASAKTSGKSASGKSVEEKAPAKDALGEVLNEAEVKAPAATAAAAAPQGAETKSIDVVTPAPKEEAAPALSQIPVIIKEDTTLEAFAKAHNVTVEKLKELNPGALPADGKLTKNLLLMIPGK